MVISLAASLDGDVDGSRRPNLLHLVRVEAQSCRAAALCCVSFWRNVDGGILAGNGRVVLCEHAVQSRHHEARHDEKADEDHRRCPAPGTAAWGNRNSAQTP